MMKRIKLPHVGVAASVSAAILCSDLSAQDDSDESNLYELSPFQVDGSGDFGYSATNSTSATRINVRNSDIPTNIQVFTSEFLNSAQQRERACLVAG